MVQDSQPTWQELLDLLAQLTESDYETASISYGSISLRLSKVGGLVELLPTVAEQTPPAPGHWPTEGLISAATATPAAAPVQSNGSYGGETVTAPMLGVFYRRPSPGSEPFVVVGQEVDRDTTIGIIEIMKLMNPVTAGVSGVIASFEVEDGTSVEFGQVLVRLEPTP